MKDVGVLTASTFFLQACTNPRQSAFTKPQRDCLIAISERIVPRDEFPGATDLGVINYVENWVTKYYPERLYFYQNGAEYTRLAALKIHGKEFQDLDVDTQISFLGLMEQEKHPRDLWKDISQKEFFDEMISRTFEGYYGDPRHGGNKNYASYKMMKLDTPLVIGQNRYEK